MDDLDACTSILEHHEWNLQDAVQYTLAMMESPQPSRISSMFDAIADISGPPAYESPTYDSVRLAYVADEIAGTSSAASYAPASFSSISASSLGGLHSASTRSPHRIRLLNFNIEYRHYNIPLVLQDSSSVGKIKELLSSQTNIPVEKMELHGWIHKNDSFILDSDVLRDLKLPKDNNLYLLTPSSTYDVSSLESLSGASQHEQPRTYELEIFFVDRDKRCTLKFPGSKTISQVKEDVVNISGPVRYQVWWGWPVDDDSVTLSASGIDYPTHQLKLSISERKPSNCVRTVSSVAGSAVKNPDESMEMESDSEDPADSVHYDEMTDDDVIRPAVCRPLMPDNCEDQTEAAEHFCREFASRYGETHPVFYFGSLDDAIRESLLCKARDRKLLAIYLHHDQSIFSNVFCSQVLCVETMVAFMCNNFITWAWDLTSESNREILLGLCNRHFGSVASNTVRIFKPDQLPLLLIISRNRGSNEVVKVLHGNSTLDEIMMNMIHTVEVFREQLETDIAEEDEREARERVLRDQDAAYQVSLEADRAKAVLRKQEEEERQKQEEEEQNKLKKQKMMLKEMEDAKQALQQSMAELLPNEPDSGCPDPITLIRFRCPGGKVLTRRFLATDPLRVLLTYIGAAGYQLSSYKVLTTYPRRDLNQVDKSLTLNELKLCPQETLTLEEV